MLPITSPRPETALLGARPEAAAVQAVVLVLVVALMLVACGRDGGDRPLLSERAYLARVKRDCLTAKRIVKEAASQRAVPAVYLRRVADRAEGLHRAFATVRPPARLRRAHRELVSIGGAQLALIQAALQRLASGDASGAAAELALQNRTLVRRANGVARRLGLAQCVNDPGTP